MNKYRKNIARAMLMVLFVASSQFYVSTAQAASITGASDTMSRLKASTASNHTIQFVTPTGLGAGQSITVTFSAGFTGVASIVFDDVDFATAATCTGFSDRTLAASPATTTFGVTSSGQVVTILSGTGTITAGHCVQIEIGTNATFGTTGTNQVSNGAIGSSDTIAIGGTFGDTGTMSVDIITNDQITVQATVDPTITFTLIDSSSSDNTIGFGSLTSGAARYATAAGTYTTGGSASDVSAVTMTVATNASSGYVLSYNGATLTSGADTIAVATITGDADGTPGTAQFATGYTASGGSTVATAYANGSNNWSYVASTTTTIVSRTTPTNTETIGGHYLANIGGATPAGAYSTIITYIATGTF